MKIYTAERTYDDMRSAEVEALRREVKRLQHKIDLLQSRYDVEVDDRGLLHSQLRVIK